MCSTHFSVQIFRLNFLTKANDIIFCVISYFENMKACWIGSPNIAVIYKNMKLHFYQYWHFVQGWHFRFLSVGICSLRWVFWHSFLWSIFSFNFSFFVKRPNNNLLHSLCCCYLLTKNEEKINDFFQILWKSRCHILVTFHLIWKKNFLYWEFDSKSWIVDFSLVSLMKKHHKTTFSVKISV